MSTAGILFSFLAAVWVAGGVALESYGVAALFFCVLLMVLVTEIVRATKP